MKDCYLGFSPWNPHAPALRIDGLLFRSINDAIGYVRTQGFNDTEAKEYVMQLYRSNAEDQP